MDGLSELSEQLEAWGGAIGLAILVLAAHHWLQRGTLGRERAARARLARLEAPEELLQPPSGAEQSSGATPCGPAPPEHDALRVVDGVARLAGPPGCLDPSRCELGPFVIGELDGRGVLDSARSQGTQAARLVARSARVAVVDAYDAVIVGASPAGVSAALALREAERRFVLLDCEAHGGTVLRYPCGKAMRAGELELPGYGRMRRRRMSTDEVVVLWLDIRDNTGLAVHMETHVASLTLQRDGMWCVEGAHGTLRATHVILALGARGPSVQGRTVAHSASTKTSGPARRGKE